jgi:hypothetical protein
MNVVLYSEPGEYLPINAARERLCGYYNLKRACVNAATRIEAESGHAVCTQCERVTARSGIRLCDLCDRQFFDPARYLNPRYEIYCPRCVKLYGIDE